MLPPLEALGWNRFFAEQLASPDNTDSAPARVVIEYQDRYRLMDAGGYSWAQLNGNLRRAAQSDRLQRPAVGDWVMVRPGQGDDMGTIVQLLKRRTRFIRQAAGRRPGAQIVAANIDTVFVVTSCNQDFNIRRIERYLTTVWSSGAKPVIVLNKSDLSDDLELYWDTLASAAPDTPVAMVSAVQKLGLDQLLAHIRPGESAALVGSSGVGKSTLVNWLMGRTVQKVGAIRDRDDRGRHVTTHRELFLIPGRGILIDTPGMRELKLWSPETGLLEAFADIERLAGRCRFRDCGHQREPGCAIEQAVRTGEVERTRVGSYLKLLREREAPPPQASHGQESPTGRRPKKTGPQRK